MRKKEQQITDKEEIEKILKTPGICRIAFHDQPFPYILPFNYGYKDQKIYIHAAPDGKKTDLIRKNNHVAFVVEHEVQIVKAPLPCGWTTRYKSVTGYGKARIFNDIGRKTEGLDIIMKQYGLEGKPEYSETSLQNMIIIEITIENISGKCSSHYSPRQDIIG